MPGRGLGFGSAAHRRQLGLQAEPGLARHADAVALGRHAQVLRAVQRRRHVEPRPGKEVQRRGERQVRIGQPGSEQAQSVLPQSLDDARRRPQPAAARHLHGDAVVHAERGELGGLHRRDDALVHQDGQRAEGLQRLVVADAVGRQRRLERPESRVGQDACHGARRVELVAGIGVGPVEARRRELAHRADQAAVVVGRLRRAELDVEAVVACGPARLKLPLGRLQAGRVHGPAQLHLFDSPSSKKLAGRAAGAPAPQVMAGEVDGGLGERLADRERRPDGALHARVHFGEIGGLGAEQRGREVELQRARRALGGLVAPGLHRHRLAAALHAVLVGEAREQRWPHAAAEELELADQRIVQPADLDADDLAHGCF